MDAALPVVAGMVSTTLFTASALPMVVKAARTRDMDSYSRGNLVLSNVGNIVHTLYVVSLPFGPIWALHGFYLVTTAFMLAWYLRHAGDRRDRRDGDPTPAHDTDQWAPAPALARDRSRGRGSGSRTGVHGRRAPRGPTAGRTSRGPIAGRASRPRARRRHRPHRGDFPPQRADW